MWIKKLLLLLYLSLQLCLLTMPLGHAQELGSRDVYSEQDLELWWDSKTLKKFLVDPSPNASGIFEFFEQYEGDPSKEAVIRDQLTRKYPRLRKYYQEGLNFKSTYREMVRTRIQEEHYGYHLFFTNYAFQRVLELSESVSINQIEKPLDFRERERRALGHVAQRYGFPGGITAADLRRGIVENRGELSQHYENALLTYDRLMFFFEGETERSRSIAPLSVDEILETLRNEIMEARLNNLRATINLAKEKRAARNIHFKSKEGDSISAHEIGSIHRIQEVNAGTETHEIVARGIRYSTDYQRRSWWGFLAGGWTNFTVPNLKDHPWFRNFSLPERFKALKNKNSVLIESESGRYVLSRTEYEKLLNELRLKKSENLQAKRNKLLKRFQIEASAREALLADLYSLITQTQFQNTNSLLNRLENHQNTIANEQRATGLSLSLVSSIEGKNSYSSLGFLNGIRWWGYSLHPGNWLRREILAQDQLLPSIFKLKNGMAAKRLDKHQRNALKAEGKSTKSWRATRGLRRWRAYRMIVAAVVLIGPFTPGLIEIPNFWSKEESSAPATSLNQNPMQMEQDADNHYIGSKEDIATQGQVEYFKIRDFQYKNWNRIIHIATESNIPPTALANKDPHSEGNGVILVEPEPLGTVIDENDFNISTTQYVEPLNGRIGIATPPGFEVSQLRVQKVTKIDEESWSQSPLNQGEDYRVYRIPANGLYYLELVDPEILGVKYSVNFIKEETPKPSIDFELDPETLKQLSLANYKIGATKIAKSIYEFSQGGHKSLSLDQIEGIYQSQSLYTFEQREDFESTIASSELLYDIEQYSSNGYLWYQCTGAASHLEMSFNFSFERQGAPYEAQQLSGFKYGDRFVTSGWVVSGDMAHRQIVVSHLSKAYEYKIFDSTPYLTEPPMPEPIELPQAYDEEFIRPSQTREIKEAESIALAKQERAEILFAEAIAISNELGELAEKYGPGNPIFKNQRELRALPQTKLMAISRILQEVHSGELELSEGFFRVYLVSQSQFEFFRLRASQEWAEAYHAQVNLDGGYQAMVRSIIKKISENMNQLYDGLDRNADNSNLKPIQFLSSNQWRHRHQNLLQIISVLDLDALYDRELSNLEYTRLSRSRCEEAFIWTYQ